LDDGITDGFVDGLDEGITDGFEAEHWAVQKVEWTALEMAGY
jgi:hypothetical protein